MEKMETQRSRSVLYDHLHKAKEGRVEDDLNSNYAEDVVFLSNYGVYHGLDGARYLAKLLNQQLPEARFHYDLIQVEGELGFLKWSAEAGNGNTVTDGADSFVIRDGKIVAQTIYYTYSKS